MAIVTQFAFGGFKQLKARAIYLEDRNHNRHKKVTFEKVSSWNKAPSIQDFPDWVAGLREKWFRKRRRGRPVSWGTWYTFTFPRQSNLSPAEKHEFATLMIRNLGAHSCGVGIWHHKQNGASDLNLAVSPIALRGQTMTARRDAKVGEFRRLQKVSDRFLDQRLNKLRSANQQRQVRTVASVQQRRRKKKNRKLLAEELVENTDFTAFLCEERSGKKHSAKEWAKKLQQCLTQGGNKIENWNQLTWAAKVLRPGLPEAQTFRVRRILSEAVQLYDKRYGQGANISSQLSPSAGTSTEQKAPNLPTPPPPTRSNPSSHPKPAKATNDMPAAEWQPDCGDIFQALLHSRNKKTPIKNKKVLRRRLQNGGLQTERSELEDKIRIVTRSREESIFFVSDILLAAQCHLVRHKLYEALSQQSATVVGLDLRPLSEDEHPPEEQCAQYYRLTEKEEFWSEAHEIVSDPAVRKAWLEALRTTGGASNIIERIESIRQHLAGSHVDPWHQFILLLAHCDQAMNVIYTHVLPVFQMTEEFRSHRDYFLECQQPVRAMRPPPASHSPLHEI